MPFPFAVKTRPLTDAFAAVGPATWRLIENSEVSPVVKSVAVELTKFPAGTCVDGVKLIVALPKTSVV